MNTSALWNGYTVYGDSSELDKMVAAEGLITLSPNDIIRMLDCDCEHWIVSGYGTDCPSALNAAISTLPFPLEAITAMAIHIRYSCESPLLMKEITGLIEPFDPFCEVVWSFSEDSGMEHPRKIVILVSASR